MRYSALSLLRGIASGGSHWPDAFPEHPRRTGYDVVIIGGGGHGLATAHYLAKNHGITNVAVLEAGWLGGGNTARNTTIVRSDYLLDASFLLKDFALKLWRGLSRDLNFNVMYSPRGYVDLAHSDGELEHFTLRANAMRLRGADAAIVGREALARRVPHLSLSGDARFPVSGALVQEDGGSVRHDAVAWGFARAALSRGVHLFQNCAVEGFTVSGGRITGVKIADGEIGAERVMFSVAGQSTELARMAGFPLPLECVNVQAFVSEPVKPVLDSVVNYNAGLAYASQTDKGEIVLGGATDGYNSFARRGSFARIEDVVARAIEMFPFLSRLRLLRHWSGTADIPMDGNAIVGETPIEGLYMNGGWGYAGFKATPAVGWCMADLLASGAVPALLRPFALDRFDSGALIDDSGIGPFPYLH